MGIRNGSATLALAEGDITRFAPTLLFNAAKSQLIGGSVVDGRDSPAPAGRRSRQEVASNYWKGFRLFRVGAFGWPLGCILQTQPSPPSAFFRVNGAFLRGRGKRRDGRDLPGGGAGQRCSRAGALVVKSPRELAAAAAGPP